MHVRVTTIQGAPDKMDDAGATCRSRPCPNCRIWKGSRGS
jgi:hypothetical protein